MVQKQIGAPTSDVARGGSGRTSGDARQLQAVRADRIGVEEGPVQCIPPGGAVDGNGQ